MDFKLIAHKLMPWVFTAIFFSGISTFFFTFKLFHNVDKLEIASQEKFQSYLVADELRQSSDDLTRLVRTFVITGNDDYEKMFKDVISIRDGMTPRPQNYHQIYWDFVMKHGDKPKPDGEPIAIRERMRQLSFAEQELKYLTKAKDNSDKLIGIEMDAINATRGLYRDESDKYTQKGPKKIQWAIQILHNRQYHKEKAKIMRPIDNFLYAVEKRTSDAFSDKIKSINNAIMFILFINAGLLIFSVLSFVSLILDKKNIKKEQEN
tara:strand:+ start:6370 stop:7161 length:792 start_codon:yes stop_codon:yes gene_type:complete